MIATNFAPNEDWDDAWISFRLLFQPWKWLHGKETEQVKKQILAQFQISNSKFQISCFLTGRSALYHLLNSFSLKKGSEVIVQAFTCEAVILPILANNLKPVYVDIESSTFSMNPIDLAKKITKKSRVLILQHTYGLIPANRKKILNLVKKHNLLLIEDIAHGFPSNRAMEQLNNSFLLLSFGRNKAISSVFGGAAVAPDKKIAKILSEKENRRRNPDGLILLRLILYKPLVCLIKATYDSGIGRLIHRLAIFTNLIIPEITDRERRGVYDIYLDKAYSNGLAILLLHQLQKFEQVRRNRAQICAFYSKKLHSKFSILNSPLIRFPLLIENRDAVISRMRRNGIYLGKWYDKVVAPKQLDLKKMKYKLGSCPKAEEICDKIINLPTSVTKNEAERIIFQLKKII